MRAIAGIQGRRLRAAASSAAAVVALAAGLSGCGGGGLQAATSTGTHLVVRSQATGGPVKATIDVSCEAPITTADGTSVGSSFVQRFDMQAAPGRDWTHTLDVAPGATCTATENPTPPAVLQSVSGGEPVNADGRLTGVRSLVDGGATVTLGLLAGVAT
jgi:hypothetical protein